MQKDVFDQLVRRLKNGDNSALAVLQPYQQDCMEMLAHKSNRRCSRDQAYDIFIDSVLDFRKNIVRGKVEYGNIKAYLKRMCWNKWLTEVRNTQRRLAKQENVRQEYYNTESQMPLDDDNSVNAQRLDQLRKAMTKLNEKCRRILHLAIVDRVPMAEIAGLLGLANANVAKTTKSRCYKKLLTTIRTMQVS